MKLRRSVQHGGHAGVALAGSPRQLGTAPAAAQPAPYFHDQSLTQATLGRRNNSSGGGVLLDPRPGCH
jgi:hypothetical protein